MLDLNNPQDFEKVSNDFDALALLFDAFAKNVSQQAKEAAITVTLQSRPDTGHCPGFSTLFAGYDLHFVFAPRLYAGVSVSGKACLKGRVKCYLEREYPKGERVFLNAFTFDVKGVTDREAFGRSGYLQVDEVADARFLLNPALALSLCQY
ncbi:hypothetical protein [Methylovulum psychrotolerans]|uniref:Uncharacterized protein n=1 Tax=Methylovulum psychrotolerans TaxID=1704499 RepID=A0A1Z4BY66_9GAMM|nr:hypothetical protein [Methylovulum psychrotolerans]ASF46225.1 hypothetical protein CEK71_09090 [Methylovulum psychrotolerans]